MKRIILVGGYPPPYGGVTVHIKRLKELLEEKKYNVYVLDLIGDNKKINFPKNVKSFNKGSRILLLLKTLIYILFKKSDVVHFHTSAFKNFLFSGFFFIASSLFKKRIITIHSGSFVNEVKNYNFFKKQIFKFLITKFHKIVVVNTLQKQFLLDKFVCYENKVIVIPAFIPQRKNDDLISKDFRDKIDNIKLGYTNIIVTSGFMQRYYGHHIIIDALKNLETDIALVHCFYSSYDQDYQRELEKIKEIDKKVHFFYDLTPEEFSYLINKSDIYVRATDRDGDAVAIREALFYGKAVIASDCVPRPDGVILFETNNSEDLHLKVIENLNSIPEIRLYDNEIENFIMLYKNL
jgi:glycogen(starch) synthase